MASEELSLTPGKSEIYTSYDLQNSTDDQDSIKALASQEAEKPTLRAATRKHALWLLFVALCLLPAIVLAAYTNQLSEHIGRSGCTPNGDFVIPFTASIWDKSLFFIPSLSFTVSDRGRYSGLTIVRIIDITWDLAIARGSQALLAWLAYRIFRRVLQAQMQTGEVGYDVFSEVTLHIGQLRSLPGLWRRSWGKVPLPRTSGARAIHIGMALVTLYLLAIPTLFAAMTGYASVGLPVLDFSDFDDPPDSAIVNHTTQLNAYRTQECDGPLLPAFGTIQHTCFPYAYTYPANVTYRDDLCTTDYLNRAGLAIPDFSPMTYNWQPWTCGAYDYAEYYDRYRQSYEQCPRVGNSSADWSAEQGCAALNVASVILVQCSNTLHEVRLQAPLLNLTVFDNYGDDQSSANRDRRYNHFSCGARMVNRDWMEGIWADVPGSCTASRAYAWGFSYHITFIVSIMSAAVAVILYSLWLHAHRIAPKKVETSTFLDAALMVSRAQQQFGAEVHEWRAKRAHELILRGGQGMGDPPAYLRLRNLR